MLLVISLLMAVAGCIGVFFFGLTFFLLCIFPAVWIGFGVLVTTFEGTHFDPGYYAYRVSQLAERVKDLFSRLKRRASTAPKAETWEELNARRKREISGELSTEMGG